MPDLLTVFPETEALDAEQVSAAFAEWLPQRRWFQGKARTVSHTEVREAIDLGDGLIDLIVDVSYDDGATDHYQVPVTVDADSAEADLVLATTDGAHVAVTDALTSLTTARRYAELIVQGMEFPAGTLGVVRGMPVTAAPPPLPEEGRVLRGEQSNTSVIFGDSLILKVLRRLESGEHPDIELTRGLTEEGFEAIPPQVGSLVLVQASWPTALGVLAHFVSGAEDGWEWATTETGDIARGHEADAGKLGELHALGVAVGKMHRVLERIFPAHAAGPAELSSWSHAMRAQLERVMSLAADRAPEAAAVLEPLMDDLWRIIDDLQAMPLSEIGPMTRIHGDLHLGQTLRHPDKGWQLLDFEGEPAKPLEARRQLSSPLRDVAGMVRSFDYAAAGGALAAGEHVEDLPEALIEWSEAARSHFLAGYSSAAPEAFERIDARPTLVTAFELDKAVYELGYEMANRPSWVPIPTSGIERAVRRYQAVQAQAEAASAPAPQELDPTANDPSATDSAATDPKDAS